MSKKSDLTPAEMLVESLKKPTFNVGDVVRVKAPQPKAPAMTVISVTSDAVDPPLVTAVWFVHFVMHTAMLPASVLEIAPTKIEG